MQITEFLSEIRRLIAEGQIEDALEALIVNKTFCNRFINDLILLKSRFSSNKRNHQILGLVAYSESNNTENQVSNALLQILKKIENENLRKIKKSDRKNGELLYRIPNKMPLEKEVKCIIRIAYSLEKLIRDLTIDNETQIQSIQITEIMSVELLDINQQAKFSIRTCTDEEQFIIHEDFTQWIFFVTPLETGRHKLLLKVSVIEVFNNKERKRNITLEKVIDISTDIATAKKSDFVLIPLNQSRELIKSIKEIEILKERIHQLENERRNEEELRSHQERRHEQELRMHQERRHEEERRRRYEEEERRRYEEERRRMFEEELNSHQESRHETQKIIIKNKVNKSFNIEELSERKVIENKVEMRNTSKWIYYFIVFIIIISLLLIFIFK